jgi:hypothetical protein
LKDLQAGEGWQPVLLLLLLLPLPLLLLLLLLLLRRPPYTGGDRALFDARRLFRAVERS